MKTKILCILDGFGLGADSANNAITRAKMPNLRRVMSQYFWTTLGADGEDVGQEAGLVGNSEVGHMNIGGLQLVPQLSYQITNSAESNFEQQQMDQIINPNQFLTTKFETSSKTVHLIGLFSTGTIHSDLRHWAGAVESAGKAGAAKIVLHLMSDGRDSDKKSLVATWQYFITEFKDRLMPFEDKIFLGSLGGRFYGMDRDSNMDRTIQHLEMIFSPVDNYPDGTYDMYQEPICNYFNNQYVKFNGGEENKKNWFSPWLKDFYTDPQKDPSKNYWNETYQTLMNGETYYEFEDKTYFTYRESADFIHTSDFNLASEKQRIQYLFPTKTVTSSPYIFQGNLDQITNILKAVTDYNYKKRAYDENICPITSKFFKDDEANINPKDTLWLINFRSDRMKQTTKVLCEINQQFELNLDILAMNDFGIDEQFKYLPVFKTQKVQNTLAQTIAKQGKSQLHIAETEKYAHVTYFLNGGSQDKNASEDWELIPSNKVNSHAELPDMKAKEITDYILEQGLGKYDYIMVNYANPDMVAHTGLIPESIASVEFLDQQLGRLIEQVEANGHSLIITADHGNCEFVGEFTKKSFSFSQELNKQIENIQNLTDTEHNPNPLPCIVVDQRFGKDNLNMPSFLDSLQHLDQSYRLNLNLPELSKVLEQQNYTLVDVQKWLDQSQLNQLKKDQLPLWYVGALLLAM
jgi:bisphosphoglycerate-independent phosphoglycerate mutase (AlkP superfamily)